MSKMIAVCGSPESGKTSFSLKLAQELYYQKKGTVLFLSPDMRVPSMAYIFPHSKSTDLFSIGKALDKTDIYTDDVLKQLVPVKTMRNFGFFGYTAGENKYSYPRPNVLEGMETKLQVCKDQLDAVKAQMETAKTEVEKPFPQEAELNEKTVRLNEINIALNLDERDHELVDGVPDEGDTEIPARKPKEQDRGR